MSAVKSGTSKIGPVTLTAVGGGGQFMAFTDTKFDVSPKTIKCFSANSPDTGIYTGNLVGQDQIYTFWSLGVFYAINLGFDAITVEFELGYEIPSTLLAGEFTSADVVLF